MKPMVLFAAAILSLASAPADAAQIKLEFSGTLTSLTDGLGLFSSPSPVGQAASLSYYFDEHVFDGHVVTSPTEVEPGIYAPFSTVWLNYLMGADAISGFITVGGVTNAISSSLIPGNPIAGAGTRTFEFEKLAYGDQWGYGSVNLRSDSATTIGFDDHNDYYRAEIHGGAFSTSPDGITNADLTAPLSVGGAVSFDFNRTTGLSENYLSTVGQISLGTLTISTIAAVPEPATWAMMIIGFGAVGAMLRRDREGKRRLVAA